MRSQHLEFECLGIRDLVFDLDFLPTLQVNIWVVKL